MSDGGRKPIYGGDDWRTGDAPHEHEAVYDFLVDLIRGGLAQVAFLGAPALWIVAGTSVYTVEIATAAVTALVVVSLLITTFRGGHLPVGRPWPVLTNRRLGTTGWRAFLTRSVYLSSTLLIAAFGGVLAQAAGGSYLANVLAAGTLSVTALVALPYLSGPSSRARFARFCYCVLGILPAIVISVVAPAGIDSTSVLAAVTVLALAAVDTRLIVAMRGR